MYSKPEKDLLEIIGEKLFDLAPGSKAQKRLEEYWEMPLKPIENTQ